MSKRKVTRVDILKPPRQRTVVWTKRSPKGLREVSKANTGS
jgi:hypothetical protein